MSDPSNNTASVELLTAHEVSVIFRVTRGAVTKWVRSGLLPAVQPRPGMALRFRREDIDRLLEPRTIDPELEPTEATA